MTSFTPAASFLIGGMLLVTCAGFFAACIRQRSFIAFGLTTYLFAWAILVGITLSLSPFDAVRSSTTWAWLVASVVIAVATWLTAGRPVPPVENITPPLRVALSDPVVAVLAGVFAIGLAYIASLAVATPENEEDALIYHVPRAALWYQDHGVGYIPRAIDIRLNGNPPNGEIGELFTMLISGTQRFVGVGQVVALLACALATTGIARRVGYAHPEALFGGLLLVGFPVVLTQAWTALNDLLVASFLLAGLYFLLGKSRVDTPLAGLAIGLAIGTKFTGLLVLPLLALVTIVAETDRSRGLNKLVYSAGLGVACGSAWYLVNVHETGKLDGGLVAAGGQAPTRTPSAILETIRRFVFDGLDVSGAGGSGWLWYIGVGIVISTAGIVGRVLYGRGLGFRWALGAGSLVAIAPILVASVYAGLHRFAGDGIASAVPNNAAGAYPSWFGPLGSIALVAGVIVTTLGVRGGRYPLVVGLMAVAPVVLAFGLPLALTYDPWRGRFLIVAFALAAASWGGFLRYRWLAWGIAGIAGTTMTLALANAYSKPLGLWPLSSGSTTTVWGKPDWHTQSVLRSTEREREMLRFAETLIPDHVSLTVAQRKTEALSQYFGRNLTRRVDLVADGQSLGRAADWLIAAPGVRPVACPRDWKVMRGTPTGWLVAERVGSSMCAPARLSNGTPGATAQSNAEEPEIP